MKHQLPMCLVTGADWSHARSLLQFIDSANRFEPHTELIVYDLGMTAHQKQEVTAAIRFGHLEAFPFENYPDYFDISKNAGEYAWKPVIVATQIDRRKGSVCWMDAGTVIRKPLWQLRFTTWRRGFFALTSGGSVTDWTYPATLDYFGLPRDWGFDLRNLSASVVAFDPTHPVAKRLSSDWAECALARECIAPAGSSRKNHRQDQAVLTVLAYRAGLSPVTKWWRGREFMGGQDILPEPELLVGREVPDSMRHLMPKPDNGRSAD